MLKKTVLLLAFSLAGVSCLIPDFIKSDLYNIYAHTAIETKVEFLDPVSAKNVTYYYVTVDNPNESLKLDSKNVDILGKRKSKLVFFIHGWLDNRKVEWFQELKDALFKTYGAEYAIVQVDWEKPAFQTYLVAYFNTKYIAKFVADFIIDVHKTCDVKLEDIFVVGHSLGGQIAGFVGKHIQKKLGEKLPRIIALDPAGPLFEFRPEDKRLNKDDADVVMVIHSDGGTFGFKAPCGTIDIFLNGGAWQPGCIRFNISDIFWSSEELVLCDHQRAYQVYSEAVAHPGSMVAVKCGNWGYYLEKKCEDVRVAIDDLTTKAEGKFYVETNSEPPFRRKVNGTSVGLEISKILGIASSIMEIL